LQARRFQILQGLQRIGRNGAVGRERVVDVGEDASQSGGQ